MNDFELPDEDEQALMKKPRPVGWFAAGALAIVGLGFAFGFYLPLSSAHEKLLNEHEKLAKKSHELDHALKEKSAALSSAESRRQDLVRFVSEAGDKEKGLRSKLEIGQATVENELKAFIKAKLVESVVTDEGLEVTFAEKVLFRPRTSSVLPQAKGSLCSVADILKQNGDFRIALSVPADADDTKYWETAGERVGSLANLLEGSCQIAADKISSAAVRPSESDQAGKVVVLVGPAELPRVKGSEAPLGEGTPGASKDG